MKKLLSKICLVAFVTALASFSLAEARDVHIDIQINQAPLEYSSSPPPLGRRQGWLSVSNRDWHPYTLVIGDEEELHLHRGWTSYGGIMIPSGATITIALDKDTYSLVGDNSEELKVRVRQEQTTTLSLEPFGYYGNTGLKAVVNDGKKIRDAILFDAAPSVIVQSPPPSVIVQSPPPAVIVQPPPPAVVVQSPPPAVIVQSPPPAVIVQSPPPAVVVQSPPPAVVVQPPPSPVIVQPPYLDHDYEDDDHNYDDRGDDHDYTDDSDNSLDSFSE